MSANILLLVSGGMSVIVAIEAVWVRSHLLPENYRRWISLPAISTTLQTIYYLGLPYFLLLTGMLPPRFWGLSGWDTLAGAAIPLPVAEFVPHLLTTVGSVVYRWLPDIGGTVSTATILGGFLLLLLIIYLQNAETPDGWHKISGLQIIFDVVHWGLYRAILWLIVGNLYLATIGGMVVVAMEWVLASRIGGQTRAEARQLALRFGMGAIAATGFIFVPNLWLIAVTQWLLWQAVRMVVGVWLPQRGTAPPARQV